METRSCVKCGVNNPLSEFYPNQKQCKTCAKAYAIAWRKANPDKQKVIDKKRNKKNWAKLRVDPVYLEKKKKYRESRKEIYLSNAIVWNKENKERYNDNIRRHSNKRRALKKKNKHEPYTEKQVLDIYGTVCYLCGLEIDLFAPRRIGILGWEKGLHIDHVVPIVKNGPDILENVRPTHGRCNIDKKAFDIPQTLTL